MSIKEQLKKELKDWAISEFKNIKKEETLNRNQSFAFNSMGGLGELLTLMIFPNSMGSSSKGGCAFDNKEYNEDGSFKITREVKCLSLDGTKHCKICIAENKINKTNKETKVPRFQKRCLFCKQSSFYIPKDSRWGIDAKDIKYHNDKFKLDEYILYISEFVDNSNSINVKCFKILSSNDYFKKYINNQYTNGKSNTCNFMPYSWDFYLSGPIKLFEINLYENDVINEIFMKLENDKIMNVPKNIIETNKKNCSYIGEILEDSIEYDKIIQYCKIKNKSLGKKRGIVTRK